MSEYRGFEREAGPFVKLWAGVCSVTGWRCRCPRCSGKMERAPAPDEAYIRKGRVLPAGGGSRFAGNPSTTFSQVRITPVYDTCTECGRRIRRGNIKLTLT